MFQNYLQYKQQLLPVCLLQTFLQLCITFQYLLGYEVTDKCFHLCQRQAGSKQQNSLSLQGLELGENHWESNWLDRWMAVRPWENRLLDCNAKESLPTHEDKDEEANSQITPKGKVSTSTPGLSKKKGVNHKKSYSDVSCTSFARPANVLPSTSLGSSKQKAKAVGEVFEEVSSQPTDIGSKDVRNSKDKLVQVNAPAKKRLSLPNNGKHTVSLVQMFFFNWCTKYTLGSFFSRAHMRTVHHYIKKKIESSF